MTSTHHSKVLKQIGHKPGKHKKYLKNNTPKERKHGESTRRCVRCGRTSSGNIRS
ncbi:hypothetical protein GOV11_03240, partial [Candidatus Woesearchaeota archaeon]|nr:hypothetical protein [Candidatus Woesearchaeota archaeon]